jgi:hypothetical protein
MVELEELAVFQHVVNEVRKFGDGSSHDDDPGFVLNIQADCVSLCGWKFWTGCRHWLMSAVAAIALGKRHGCGA